MVTAGVYLIARSHPIFRRVGPVAQTVVVAVGARTLLIGGIIGAPRDDIKRVTRLVDGQQIGYMFLAVGLGGVAYGLR
jgi:NADH-quinone oxidoreductase subunit L